MKKIRNGKWVHRQQFCKTMISIRLFNELMLVQLCRPIYLFVCKQAYLFFLQDYLPIDVASPTALFQALDDGVILCKLVNWASPHTIDERAINKDKLNFSTIHENITLAVSSAISIGCGIVNIDPDDIVNEKSYVILGLLWQLIRVSKIDLFLIYFSRSVSCLDSS